MQQYARFKQQHPDCVLFFRMGDFYEMFNEDALTAHKALGITLTQRTPGVPMAGVPYHSVDTYIRRMIDAGYRVAICDQIQDPKEAKGIVDRAVTRVITPGTLVEESLLDDAMSNVVAAVAFTGSGNESAGVIAAIEASTGSFELFDTDSQRLADDLARINPSELLYADTATGQPPERLEKALRGIDIPITPRPAWHFRLTDARDELLRYFGVATLDGFGLSADDPALAPAAALLLYLRETQSPNEDSPRLAHLQPPRRRVTSEHVILDAAVLRSLEIDRTMRSGSTEGSLLGTLNRCATPMGRRLLRQWICFPLTDPDKIRARQDVVAALMQDHRLADDLQKHISRIQDVARISGRLGTGRATPRDLAALGKSLLQVKEVLDCMTGTPALHDLQSRLTDVSDSLEKLGERLSQAIVASPPAHTREGGIIRDGFNARLDELRGLQQDATTWLARYQQQLIEQTQLQKLKVGYNRVFGYYIELSKTAAEKAPESFIRKQTLKNAERYITPELKEFENKITSAESRAVDLERKLFADLCADASRHAGELNIFSEIIAETDILLNFADRALRLRYTRPTLVDEPVLDIKQGKHPVLEELLGEGFVPNDCRLGIETEENENGFTMGLITGPNMAGKSTYIRQTALIVLLAHTGSFVPAESATIGITDRIFTRVGASDELHLGQSTFMVEMTEAANILHHATKRSLVILDEIGRGTSTLDGLSLAWAIAEYLSAVGARTLFATHYHELTELADVEGSAAGNLHVAVREWEGDIIFLHRILPGRTNQSYGIHVAKIAGLPPETITRAETLLNNLSVTHHPGEGDFPAAVQQNSANINKSRSGGETSKRETQVEQLPLFTEYLQHPVIEELREIDLEALSPLQAFDLLRRLRADALADGKGSSNSESTTP